MRIIINSEPRDVAEGLTVDQLIRELGLDGRPCAAEVNRELVPRDARGSHQLAEGDQIELVTLVGGG